MDWSRLRTELVWAYEGKPYYRHYQCHEFSAIIAWLILKGTVVAYSPARGSITARAGQWLFVCRDKDNHDFSDDARLISLRLVMHWPNQRHYYNHEDWILFDSERFPQLKRQSQLLVKQANRFLRTQKPGNVTNTEIITAPGTFADYLSLQLATFRWVRIYDRVMQQLGVERTTMAHLDARVSECLAVLDKLPMNKPFDITRLARSLGLSVGQLNRVFANDIGMTPKAYVDQLRLNEAMKMLNGTTLPLKQLAFTLGFKQQSHFSSWFRKKTRYYPKEYREKHAWPLHQQIFETLKLP